MVEAGGPVSLLVVSTLVAEVVAQVPVMHPYAVEVVELGVASSVVTLWNVSSSIILCKLLATPGILCDLTFQFCPGGEA